MSRAPRPQGAAPASNARRAQLEAAPTPSSYIPTAGSTVTRAAETFTIPAANLPYNSLAMSIQMNGRLTYADEGSAGQVTYAQWEDDTNNRITLSLDTDSTATGEVNFTQVEGGTADHRRHVLTDEQHTMRNHN